MKDFNELYEELMSKEQRSLIDAQLGFIADMTFSLRMKQGLTQQQLADKAGVIIEDIHRMEGGSIRVSDVISSKVLGALNNMSGDEFDSIIDKWNSTDNVNCVFNLKKEDLL